MPSLVSAERLAEILAVDKTTVWRWVREHRVPHYRPTRSTIRFDIAEVKKALAR